MQPVSQPTGSRLVPAKCTNCGAALTVDPDQQAAICSYCNMPYIVEKEIQNYSITNITIGTQINVSGPDADNLLRLANSSLKAGKYTEAVGYADRALESDPSNVDAWIIKIIAAGYDIEGDRSSEIAAYVENAINDGADDQEEIRLYGAVLDVSRIHIQQATKLLKTNMDSIHRQLEHHRNKNDIAAMDSGYVRRTAEITNEAIEYREIVPDELIGANAMLKDKAVALSDAYAEYNAALGARYSMYGAALSAKIQARRAENLRRILAGTGTAVPSGQTQPVGPGRGLFGRLFG